MSRVKLANKIMDRAVLELAKGYRKPYAAALGATAAGALLAKKHLPPVMIDTKHWAAEDRLASEIAEIGKAKLEALRPIYDKFKGMVLPSDASYITRSGKSLVGADVLRDIEHSIKSQGKGTALSDEVIYDIGNSLKEYGLNPAKGSAMYDELMRGKIEPLFRQVSDDLDRARMPGLPYYWGAP